MEPIFFFLINTKPTAQAIGFDDIESAEAHVFVKSNNINTARDQACSYLLDMFLIFGKPQVELEISPQILQGFYTEQLLAHHYSQVDGFYCYFSALPKTPRDENITEIRKLPIPKKTTKKH